MDKKQQETDLWQGVVPLLVIASAVAFLCSGEDEFRDDWAPIAAAGTLSE